MKNSFLKLVCLVFLFSGLIVNAQTDSARLVIIRPASYTGSANLFKIYTEDRRLVKLVYGSYDEINVPAGKVKLSIKRPGKNVRTFDVEANKTYYLYAVYVPEVFSARPDVFLMDSAWADKKLSNKKMKNMKKPLLRPLNRIGANFILGSAFNSIPVIQTTSGDNSYMGFAGGAGFSIEAGREVHKYFDIAVNYSYMSRGLTPYLKNANIDFSRHYVSLTPSFVIPLGSGYMQRLKIGGGVDFYFSNTLTWETGKIPGGINDTWKYGETIGYHAQVLHEAHFSERFSSFVGFRYSDVTHSFVSGGTHFPLSSQLSKPRANGLELKLGFYYHFF